jgi:hypothetical protein
MGRQEILVRRYADARTWLQLASENDASSVFPHERMLILLAASHAFGLEDSAAGVRNASLAVEVADGSDFVPAVERARAYSELAVAEFIADGAAKAFASWDKAARYLLDSEARGDEWKDLTVIFGHVSGYLARVAETGKPPSATKDGSAYAAPERGIFLTTNPERINYYNPRHEGGLCQVIAFYADAVGAVEQAAYWKARAKSLAMTHALAPVIVAASRDEIPNLLRKEGFAIALAQARKTAQGLMVCCREWDAGRDPSRPELDIAAAFGRLGEDDRRMTEDYAGIMGLMPSVLLVARIAAEGNQEQAREKARSLAAACREIAPTSAYPELWSLAADSVERAYADGHPHYQMLELRKMFPKPKPISLDAIGLLAATAEATPEQAIGCMLGIMPTLCSWYRPNSPAFREILLPFVETYWTAALRDRKFLFSYGATVEGQLPQARLAPERERVASVLRAVRAGFRFREALPPEIQRWLHPDQSVPG